MIDSAKLQISEATDTGIDTVKASLSYTLADYFEDLVLTGKANLSGHGNALANHLTGNAGNNKLFGMAGTDHLSGGRGNDVLTGDDAANVDGAADIFVFKSHAGKDVITDFHNGEDAIDLTGYKGLDAFPDLKGHIAQSGDDVVVTLIDGDHFTLRDTQKSELDASDFIF